MNDRGLIFAFLMLTVAGLFAGLATATPQAAPASTQHRVFLPLIRSGGTAPLPQQRPSLDLIDAALKAGEISEEDALLYQAQVVAGDPALPSRFRSAEVGEGVFLVMDRIARKLANLSPTAQARLRPYLLPPTAPDSWYARNIMATGATTGSASLAATPLTWRTLDTANGKVKLWYHPELSGAETRARQIGAAIDGTIWLKLKELFGREALPDCGTSCDNGGLDERVDIYLVRGYYRSMSSKTEPEASSAWFIVGMTTSFDEVVGLIARGFMRAYPVASHDEYDWLAAALPTYAVHVVYPTDNQDPLYPRTNPEHEAANELLDKPDVSLEGPSERFYRAGAYLFFLFSGPEVVSSLMEGALNPNSLDALNAAREMNGMAPLSDEWRTFALYNWNQNPFGMYQDVDNLVESARPTDEFIIDGAGRQPFPVAVRHLAARYYHFGFDEKVRRITFTNPVATERSEGGHVWAWLYKADGTVEIEDWKDVETRVFCRDNPAENITNVILIVSNGQWRDRSKVMQTADGTVKTELSCGACARTAATTRWKARFTVSYDQSDSGDGPGYPVSARARRNGTYEATLEASAGSEGMVEWDADSAQGTVSINDLYVEPNASFPTQVTGAPTVSQTGMSLNPEACTFSLTSVATLSVGGKGVSDMVTVFHLFMHRLAVQEPADPNAPLVLRGSTSLPWPTGAFNPESDSVVQLGVTPGSGGVLGIRNERGAADAGSAQVTWELTALAP